MGNLLLFHAKICSVKGAITYDLFYHITIYVKKKAKYYLRRGYNGKFYSIPWAYKLSCLLYKI